MTIITTAIFYHHIHHLSCFILRLVATSRTGIYDVKCNTGTTILFHVQSSCFTRRRPIYNFGWSNYYCVCKHHSLLSIVVVIHSCIYIYIYIYIYRYIYMCVCVRRCCILAIIFILYANIIIWVSVTVDTIHSNKNGRINWVALLCSFLPSLLVQSLIIIPYLHFPKFR